jgi:hypothetical protein
MSNKPESILAENVKALQHSVAWLQRSFDICNETSESHKLTPEEMDDYESLTARFARTADILFNKVFRSIHYVQEGENRSWLDVLLYMEKTGVLESREEARLLKELRNDIVHEYALNDVLDLFKEVYHQTPFLLKMVKSAIAEADRVLGKTANG